MAISVLRTRRPVTAQPLPRFRKRDVIGTGLALLLLIALLEAASVALFPKPGGAILVCAAFAVVAFVFRGVTLSGALAGFLTALALWLEGGIVFFDVLIVVFVLTWLATRAGRLHKQQRGIAERPHGRDALQVFANVGLAAVLVVFGRWTASSSMFFYMAVAALAVLGEAAADTVSSEIGKAFGGTPRLITTWNRVDVGTNGGITALGTAAGVLAASVAASTAFRPTLHAALVTLVTTLAAVCGMIFDSVLGATLESRWLNNDGVNFLSTCFAAAVADGLLWLTLHLH